MIMAVIKIVTKGGHEILFSQEDAARVCSESWRTKAQDKTRYARRRNAEGKDELLHNFIMGKPEDGMFWDHINRNGLDCRRENMRISTYSQNNANRRINTKNTSGYRGVRETKEGKWRAEIKVNSKKISLGSYWDIIEAAKAYDTASLKYFGEFANLNFPLDNQLNSVIIKQ
jgi:hypothetical protein